MSVSSTPPDYFSLVIEWGESLDDRAVPAEIDEDALATRPIARGSRLRRIVIALAAVGTLIAWIQRLRRRHAAA